MENPFITVLEKIEELDYKLAKLLQAQEAHGLYRSDELMNIQETAKFLDESVQSIYLRTSKRDIPFFKKGKKILFKKSEVMSWLEGKRKKSLSEIAADI